MSFCEMFSMLIHFREEYLRPDPPAACIFEELLVAVIIPPVHSGDEGSLPRNNTESQSSPSGFIIFNLHNYPGAE